MEFPGSEGEDELRLSSMTSSTTNKRFIKFPRKFITDNCSTVCHVSVPRKLRSAMKKRSRESVSKKLNHGANGVQLLRKDGFMKSKLKMKRRITQACITEDTEGPVTKDEEEVAEALYALAGVVSNTVKMDKAISTGQRLGENSSNLTKAESSVTPIDEMVVSKVAEELKTISYRDETPTRLSNPVGSAGEPFMLHSRNDTIHPDISVGKQSSIKSGGDIAEVNLSMTAFDSEKQQTIQKTVCDSVVSGDWSDLSKMRSKLPNLEKSLASAKYPATPIEAASSRPDLQQTSKETRSNGSPLRPDLSSAISCDSRGLEIPLQSRLAELPACFKSSSGPGQSPKLDRTVITKMDAQVATDTDNLWKRCTAHVYISRFTEAFQINERKNRSMMHSDELMTNEAPKQGDHIPVIDRTGERNGTLGVVCSNSCTGSAPEKNAAEVRNAILLHKRLVQGRQLVYTAQSQRLNFLSSPARSCQLEANNGNNRAENDLEISTQLCFPGLLSQNQSTIPFPVPQNCYSSTSFYNHHSVAALQKVQVPRFVGDSSYGPSLVDAAAPSSAEQLELQRQKRASQLMAHYNSGVASPSTPNKYTEGPNLPPVFQHVQTLFPPSISSLEVLGARYTPVLQQQQQQQQLLSGTSLLPSPTVKGQYHHLPYVYEAKVGGIRSDNVPLRMVCNQHI